MLFDTQPIQVIAHENVFDVSESMTLLFGLESPRLGDFTGLLNWHGRENIFNGQFVMTNHDDAEPTAPRWQPQNLIQWSTLDNTDERGSQKLAIEFHHDRDDLIDVVYEPDEFDARDFAYSFDQRANEPIAADHLGADLDSVGPGDAFDDWRRSSEHRNWHSDVSR